MSILFEPVVESKLPDDGPNAHQHARREERAQQARRRWPLLAAMDACRAMDVAPVTIGVAIRVSPEAIAMSTLGAREESVASERKQVRRAFQHRLQKSCE